MKTLKLSVAVIMAAGLFASCGGGMKADMQKAMKLGCKEVEAQLAYEKNPSDAKLKEAWEKAQKDMEDFSKKVDEKYKDKKPDEATMKWAAEEMKKCKAIDELTKFMTEKAEAEQKRIADSIANAMALDTTTVTQ